MHFYEVTMDLEKQILGSLGALSSWVIKNGWEGYDPFDIQEQRFFLFLNRNRYRRYLLSRLDEFAPIFWRRMLGVRPRVVPKAMGLFAAGFLDLHRLSGEERYLSLAREALDWLLANPSRGYSGLAWGLPFDWQTKILIPQGTPCGVISHVIGDAFWEFYRFTGEVRYLDICRSICEFFLRDLNQDLMGEGRICFSYTPLDHFHVHNENLFVAEFLIRIGSEVHEPEYIELGLKAVEYTLSEQNPDGSLYYWAKAQDARKLIDHYHSGFEMRMLFSVWQLTGEKKVGEALRRYYDYYLANMVDESGLANIKPGKRYPVDIHGCAEAVFVNSVLLPEFPRAEKILAANARWTIENMQTDEGWFICKIIDLLGKKIKINAPYIRWGQAWMLRALARAACVLNAKES